MVRAITKPLPPAGAGPRDISRAVNNLLAGKINSLGTIIFPAGVTSAALQDSHIGVESLIWFTPTNAAAAGQNDLYVATVIPGAATIMTASAAQDRTFGYVVLG